MKICPKEDIKNPFNQIIYHKGKYYECTKYSDDELDNDYIVECELIANEYPIMDMDQIKKLFYTIEEVRDFKIKNILK